MQKETLRKMIYFAAKRIERSVAVKSECVEHMRSKNKTILKCPYDFYLNTCVVITKLRGRPNVSIVCKIVRGYFRSTMALTNVSWTPRLQNRCGRLRLLCYPLQR